MTTADGGAADRRLLSVVRSPMYGPLIGYVPDDDGPRPAVTVCVPRSGGHGCPGG